MHEAAQLRTLQPAFAGWRGNLMWFCENQV